MKRLAAIALLLPIVWLFALPVPPIQHSPWTTTTNDPTVTLQAQQPVSITTTNPLGLEINGNVVISSAGFPITWGTNVFLVSEGTNLVWNGTPVTLGFAKFSTVSDMVSFSVSTNLPVIGVVSGRVTANDGAGGIFYFLPGSVLATNLGTVFASTGIAGRWVRPFSGAVNVKWFGAVGDNTGDQTAAIDNAISTAAGDGVYVPTGTYRCVPSGTWVGILNNDGASVKGDGDGSTISVITGGGYKEGLRVSTNNCSISNLRLICDNGAGNAVAIEGAGSSNTRIDKVTMQSNWVFGIHFVQPSTNWIVSNCTFDSLVYGIGDQANSTHVLNGLLVDRCLFSNFSGDAIELDYPTVEASSAMDAAITGCRFVSGTHAGVTAGFGVGIAGRISGVTVSGCVFKDIPNAGVHVEDTASDVSVTGCSFKRCGTAGNTGGFGAVLDVVSGAKRVNFTGNAVDETGLGTNVFALRLTSAGVNNVSNIVVSANTFNLSSNVHGIYMDGSTWITVIGNQFKGDGEVYGGGYHGGTNYGIVPIGGVYLDISRNEFIGLSNGVLGNLAGEARPNLSIARVDGNFATDCQIGIDTRATSRSIVTKNLLNNCVYPLYIGTSGSFPGQYVLASENMAVNCSNPISGLGPFDYYNPVVRTFLNNVDDALGTNGWPVAAVSTTLPFRAGVKTLSSGLVNVSQPYITTNSLVFLSAKSFGPGTGALYVTNVVQGVSFDIYSTSAADTNVVSYMIIEP